MKTTEPGNRHRKRKCKCCGKLYLPDRRHFHDQKYCSKEACRHAGKLARHRRWYASDKGSAHRDPEENKRRVREWRAEHPGYWRRKTAKPPGALRDTTRSQRVDGKEVTPSLTRNALQDSLFTQPAFAVGLMASLTGVALQDSIEETAQRFILLGQDILGKGPGINPKGRRRDEYCKTDIMPRPPAPGSSFIQLD